MKNPNTTVGLSKETLKLIDKVKALQYQRLGINLSRNQILTLVVKEYLKSHDIPPFKSYQKAVESGFKGTLKQFIAVHPPYLSVPEHDLGDPYVAKCCGAEFATEEEATCIDEDRGGYSVCCNCGML